MSYVSDLNSTNGLHVTYIFIFEKPPIRTHKTPIEIFEAKICCVSQNLWTMYMVQLEYFQQKNCLQPENKLFMFNIHSVIINTEFVSLVAIQFYFFLFILLRELNHIICHIERQVNEMKNTLIQHSAYSMLIFIQKNHQFPSENVANMFKIQIHRVN